MKQRLVEWLSQRLSRRGRRLAALGAALGLVAVPTIWTLFPSLGGIWVVWRALVLVAWGIAALLIVRSADRQAQQVDELMGEAERHRSRERRKAGELAINLLLRGRAAGLQPYSLDVYLPVVGRSNGVRVAFSSEAPVSVVEWSDAKGATGYAFATGERVTARGEHARNDTYQLDQEQKEAAAHLEIVVAMPIKNQAARTIGVLSAYADQDDGFLVSDQGFEEHSSLAEAIARLLIDVCGLATDEVIPPK
ncbi:MAG TPA: hypothetical protein VII76_10495 [Acidimicrobiales bacterium]